METQMKKILAAAILLIIGATAAADQLPISDPAKMEVLIRQKLSVQLKDSMSAQLQNVRAFNGAKKDLNVVCGAVNSKNSLGAYTGFRVFVWELKDDVFLVSPEERGTKEWNMIIQAATLVCQ
jgi:hypothetical protein